MFKRFWNWLCGKPRQQEIPEPPSDTYRKKSNFDPGVHEPMNAPSGAELLDAYMHEVKRGLPKLYTHVTEADGAAMDSIDFPPADVAGSAPGLPVNDMPAPNISGVIMGFFLRQTFLGHQLSALLSQNWLIAKACWMPAKDAVRKGYAINTPEGENPEVLKIMERYDKRMKIRHNLRQFIGFGRVFGVRVAFYKFDFGNKEFEKEFYENPFNPDAITPGSYRGIVQVDPYWCVPELDADSTANPDSMHFYEPTWWQINGQRYHRSHLVVYVEGEVPDILKPAYLYGGIPLPQLIVERVYAAERTANEAPELAMCKRLITLKTDLAEMLAGGPDAYAKLNRWTQLMNNFGVKVIGTDEEVGTHDTSLADFDNLTMTQYQLVAAIAECPSTKLLGTSPKGFGASGDYEIESYHETLESIQEGKPTELVEGHHKRIMYSEVIPRMAKLDPEWKPSPTSITWNPLDTPTSKEQAEINNLNSQTDRNLVDIGAIDGVDVRDRIIKEEASGYAGIPGAYRPDETPGPGEVPAPVPAANTQAFDPNASIY